MDDKHQSQGQQLRASEEKRMPPEVVAKREHFYENWNILESSFSEGRPINRVEFTTYLNNCRYWILRFQGIVNQEDAQKLKDVEASINTWYKRFPNSPSDGYDTFRAINNTISGFFRRYRIDDILLEDAMLW
jgi:hypothetical protein